jgi:hypothetical protein
LSRQDEESSPNACGFASIAGELSDGGHIMLKSTAIHLVLVLATSLCAAATYGQDQQPSLGEIARQARKDKEKNANAPKKVLTDDDIVPSSKALSGINDFGNSLSSGSSNDASPIAKGMAAMNHVEEILNKLDPMDRATLAKLVLMDNDVEFASRRAWEDKLYAAKQQYVSHCREIVRDGRQILEDAQTLKNAQGGAKMNSNDPRAQEMLHKVQALLQDAVRTDNAYQAVVMEGWDLAKQAKR